MRLRAREFEVAPGFGDRVPVDAQIGVGGGGGRNGAACEIAQDGDADHRRGHQAGAAAAGQQAAGKRADQYGDEGAGFHQRVAADQFLLLQVLGQDGIFHRPEQGRVGSHQEQGGEQQRQAVAGETEGGDQHDADLEQLDEADQARLLELVGQLAGGGREQEERQDEEAGAQVHQKLGVGARHGAGTIGEQDHQRILEDVVVERAEKLGDEERQEAPLPHQTVLVARGNLRCGSGHNQARSAGFRRGTSCRARNTLPSPACGSAVPPLRAIP